MQDPIMLKGVWWLPSQEENKLSGTLTFSQEEGALLELAGGFNIKETDLTEQPIIILGTTQQNKSITLYKCNAQTWTYPLMDSVSGESKYRAHVIFEGVHFESEEKIKFHELYGSYTDLDAWVDVYGFTIKRDFTDNKIVSKISYELPDSQIFNIENEFEVGISFRSSGPERSIVQTEVKITQQACLVVKSKRGDVSFERLDSMLNALLALFQIASQGIPCPISIFGYSQENSRKLNDGKVYYPEINIYFQPIEPFVKQKRKLPQELLFVYKDLTAEQISAWFTSFQNYRTSVYLYRSLFYSNRLFIENRFLNIAQALESLHSIRHGSQSLPHDEFLERKKRALQSTPDDLKEWIEIALKNANYKYFRSRILELLNNKKIFLGQLIPDMDLFSKRVKDTRNEFVHHDKQKWTFQRSEELIRAIDLLTMLFESYLLEIIGFSDEKIQELLEPKIQTELTGWVHLRTTIK